MTDVSQPWTSRFRPQTLRDVANNERAVSQLLGWVRSWERGIPERRAAFLHGPPGVGKTASVVAIANDLDFDLLEVNASDYRTRSRLDELLGRGSLQSVSVLGRRRMILLDELEGVSGREDLGGISAIVNIVKETRSPVVLVATSAHEGWEEKFRPLRGISLLIEFGPVPFADILRRLRTIINEVGIAVDEEVLESISERSRGDVRSAINDLEAVARGRERVSSEDLEWLGERDRQEYTPDALMRMFSSSALGEARQVLASSYIGHDDLFDWINENLPIVLDDPRDLAEGLDALAQADIHQGRARRTQTYRLLKYMFNDMTGGVALSRRHSKGEGVPRQVCSVLLGLGFSPSFFTIAEAPWGVVIRPLRHLGNDWGRVNSALRGLGGTWMRGEGRWVVPYLRPPQIVWRYRRTWHSRQLLRRVAARIAERCHISSREAVREVIPLLRVIFRDNEGMGKEIAIWLELEDKEAEWLRY